MFSLLLLERFIDPEEVLREMRSAAQARATISGTNRAVDPFIRNTLKLTVPAATRDLVVQRLNDIQPVLSESFNVALKQFDEPQFLLYREGDFFVAHQDGNTPLIRDATLNRRVSITIFMNDDYEGGDLVLHPERLIVPPKPGTLVAFRSETTHEVTPVTRGERYSIVTWYRV